MSINLGDYSACFRCLDPDFDVLNHENALERAQKSFASAKKFVELTGKYDADYPDLAYVSIRIKALNNYFHDLLLLKYKGVMVLDKERFVDFKDTVQVASLKSSIECNYVAKQAQEEMPQFIQKIKEVVKEIEADLQRQSQPTINEGQLDDIDRLLLTGSAIEMPLLGKRFGGGDYDNLDPGRGNYTTRSVSSLVQEGGFGVSSEKDPELTKILKTLNKFSVMVSDNDYKWGVSKGS